MSTVPSGTRFIGISDRVNLTERKSAGLNSDTQPYTIDDLVDTIGVGAEGPQGVEGPAGPPGPVGPAGLEWQGTWVSGTSYVADDAVGYDGASWFCILATSGTTAPDVDTTHWALLASQGAIGPQGAQGPTGPQGAGATQTLQQTVGVGNNIVSGNFKTTLQSTGIISENTVSLSKIEIIPTQIKLIRSNGGLQQTNLYCSLTPTANRNIYLPDASGTVALTSQLTLQGVIAGGNTVPFNTSWNTDGANNIRVNPDGIKLDSPFSTAFGVFSSGEMLYSNGTSYISVQIPTTISPGNKTIYFPDASGTVALKNYKSYVALVSQSGTSDPTATVVFNDTGATFTWNYDDVGSYFASCSSPILLSGKTVVFVTTQGNPGNAQDKIFGGTRSNDSTVSLFTSSNGILNLNLEIRVYN